MSPTNAYRPETQKDTHRPSAHPRPREATSQESQLTEYDHGHDKGVKRGISVKTWVPDRASHSSPSAAGLTARVQQALADDPDLAGYGLQADVVDGVARVTGVVETLGEKEHLRHLVTSIAGIHGFEDGVSLSVDSNFTDQELEREVAEELQNDPEVHTLPEIEIKDGVAHLTGKVETPAEAKAALAAAKKSRGVTGVANHLTVEAEKEPSLTKIFHSQIRNDADSRE